MLNSTLPKQVGGFYRMCLALRSIKRNLAQFFGFTVFLLVTHYTGLANAASADQAGSSAAGTPKVQVARDLVYGDREADDAHLQSLDVYYEDNRSLRPVVIYVHGGSWAFGDKKDVNYKPDFFVSQGISFVSMNYRLRWDYKLYDQLEDIASAISWVKTNGETFGFDPGRIILMGHGAGAHLVSLVATDPSYLRAKEMEVSDVRAVVAIDTLSFDIPRVMKELGSFIERRQHRLVFSSDEKVWEAASPIHHVKESSDIPGFAVLFVADNEANTLQAKAFTKKLSQAGVDTIMIPGNSKTSDTIDDELGQLSDTPTQAMMAFIRAKI